MFVKRLGGVRTNAVFFKRFTDTKRSKIKLPLESPPRRLPCRMPSFPREKIILFHKWTRVVVIVYATLRLDEIWHAKKPVSLFLSPWKRKNSLLTLYCFSFCFLSTQGWHSLRWISIRLNLVPLYKQERHSFATLTGLFGKRAARLADNFPRTAVGKKALLSHRLQCNAKHRRTDHCLVSPGTVVWCFRSKIV